MIKTSIFLLLILILCSCSNGKNSALKKVSVNGVELKVINYDEIKDSSQIKLSELATDLHFVPLETKEECLVGYSQFYVYDKYILSNNPVEKVLVFSADGKFLRQICRSGKGPREFQRAEIAVDEENDILYVADEAKSYFMSWDLNTGAYLGDIPRPYNGRIKSMIVSEEGNLIVAPVVGYFPSGDFYMWEQDLQGNLIRGIKAPHQDFYKDSDARLLHFNGSGYNYIPYGSDTIYRVNPDRLEPAYLVDFGIQNNKLIGKVGGKSFSYKFESERFLCGRVYTLLTVETTQIANGTSTRTTGKNETLFLDKKTNKIYLNERIINDFSGIDLNLFSLQNLANNTLFYTTSPVDFIQKSEEYLQNPEADPKTKERIKKVLPTIKLDDNPILIIGHLKK